MTNPIPDKYASPPAASSTPAPATTPVSSHESPLVRKALDHLETLPQPGSAVLPGDMTAHPLTASSAPAASSAGATLLSGWIQPASTAAPSFNRQGESIMSDSSTARLILAGFEDPRFHIAVLPSSPEQAGTRCMLNDKEYFCIELADQSKVWLDLADFAERFHVRDDQVRTAADSGHISSLLEKRKNLGAVLDNYEMLAQSYQALAAPGKASAVPIKPIQSPPSQHLTSDTLMKIVRVAIRDLDSVPPSELTGTQATSLTVRGHQVLAVKDPEGTLQVALLRGHLNPVKEIGEKEPGFLGAGSFGIAYEGLDLQRGDSAIKVVQPVQREDFPEYANPYKQLINEAQKLRFIHQNGQVPGIVSDPHAVFTITTAGPTTPENKEATPLLGFWGPRYNCGDAEEYIHGVRALPHGSLEQRHPREVIAAVSVCLGAAGYLEHLNIKHGDIKPGNILVEEDDSGMINLSIADFGGAQTYDELWDAVVQEDEPNIGMHTSLYCSSEDKEALFEVHRDIKEALAKDPPDPAELQYLHAELIEREIGRDRLALAITLTEILTGYLPFELTSDHFSDLPADGRMNQAVAQMLIDRYGTAVHDALQAMMHPDPMQRADPFQLAHALQEDLSISSSEFSPLIIPPDPLQHYHTHPPDAIDEQVVSFIKEALEDISSDNNGLIIGYLGPQLEAVRSEMPWGVFAVGVINMPKPTPALCFRNVMGYVEEVPLLQPEAPGAPIDVATDNGRQSLETYVAESARMMSPVLHLNGAGPYLLRDQPNHWIAQMPDRPTYQVMIVANDNGDTKTYYGKYSLDNIDEFDTYHITLYDDHDQPFTEMRGDYQLDDLESHPWLRDMKPLERQPL